MHKLFIVSSFYVCVCAGLDKRHFVNLLDWMKRKTTKIKESNDRLPFQILFVYCTFNHAFDDEYTAKFKMFSIQCKNPIICTCFLFGLLVSGRNTFGQAILYIHSITYLLWFYPWGFSTQISKYNWIRIYLEISIYLLLTFQLKSFNKHVSWFAVFSLYQTKKKKKKTGLVAPHTDIDLNVIKIFYQ